MESDSQGVNSSAEWGDFPLSPKGDEKEVLRTVVFPTIVRNMRSQGASLRSMIDIGADTGYITGLIRKSANVDDEIEATAIELNPDREDVLRAEYDDVFLGSWNRWHASHSDKKVDLIVSSHSLYYFSDPLEAIDEMSEHLTQTTDNRQQTTDNGRICLILEDFKSGKLKLLQRAGIVSADTFVTPRGEVVIINPSKLAERLSEKFDVESHAIPINVKFNTIDEAVERFQGFFAGDPVTPEQIRGYVERELVKNSDNTYTWRRDSVAVILKKKK